jgi:hypothetical protein
LYDWFAQNPFCADQYSAEAMIRRGAGIEAGIRRLFTAKLRFLSFELHRALQMHLIECFTTFQSKPSCRKTMRARGQRYEPCRCAAPPPSTRESATNVHVHTCTRTVLYQCRHSTARCLPRHSTFSFSFVLLTRSPSNIPSTISSYQKCFNHPSHRTQSAPLSTFPCQPTQAPLSAPPRRIPAPSLSLPLNSLFSRTSSHLPPCRPHLPHLLLSSL